ncbi:3-oxoacyl-[acyl-carrier-protein] reductase FabG-like [Saccostrea echinata]|uniref:3-oxoacyl-[acyl-carrier-protein] reductase FabG-like n=1 Tax=Saccostrea echinata TaxID=191078 RepID=UPI002A7FAEBF|nr:3-oxoacyl-[acyl-carrier-protein] reductase FabG-like [Saccostrea echinata]XP_061189661.1 3-oxoacyl-[acyl-carrier-protein] reductase FabG-like [Saccostrea echinata]XP_061189662.1 3-oxoacyl-[acyl-carrier-protein] reductase FabG-like [Saccostrea echinata]XP_061189663.1 3-oxoacyl-[acyl-carrier-protein] reductase FabG-like [Saccostrea echinata]
MDDHKGKVFLITGASSGIGEGIAVLLAKCGASLSLTGRNENKLEAVKEKCLKEGLTPEKILLSVGDITSRDYRRSLVDQTIKQFGKLDVLVNNAGMAKSMDISMETEENFDEIMNVNIKSAYFLTQLAIPHLKATKGCIINNSSVLSTTVLPDVSGCCSYSMSKAAMDAFTRNLAIELAPFGIRANSVRPGITRSNLARYSIPDEELLNKVMATSEKANPSGRNGEPEDVANAVSFLASDKSSYITGQDIVIDGGRFIRY